MNVNIILVLPDVPSVPFISGFRAEIMYVISSMLATFRDWSTFIWSL
jgi:hypothetical protein